MYFSHMDHNLSRYGIHCGERLMHNIYFKYLTPHLSLKMYDRSLLLFYLSPEGCVLARPEEYK